MKNTLVPLLVFLLTAIFPAISTKAEGDNKNAFRISRLIYENSSGENGITFYDYNEKNLSDMALWELLDGTRFSLNFHFYDGRNNMIKKVREYSDLRNSVQIYTYDEESRLLSEEFILMDTSRGISSFEYDVSGRLVLIKCNAYNGWINGQIKIYYRQNGLRKNGELIQNGKTTANIIYDYDENGNLKYEVWEFVSGWKQTFLYEYEKYYDGESIRFTSPNPFVFDLSSPVRREEYRYRDKISGPSNYFYGADGKLIKKTYERTDGFKTDTYYLYDGNGLLTRAFRIYSDSKRALFRFRYDSKKLMTEKEFFMNDRSNGKDNFNYDSSGRLVTATYKNSDMWLNGTINFVNGENGLPVCGKYKDEKGFDAEISFEYGEDSTLRKIIWKFSDGSDQEYTYFY